VLVKDQSTASQNGIYVASASSWSRSTDANTWDELVSAFVFVEGGTAGADSGWTCTIAAGGTLGSTAVTWVQFSGAGQITAGAGMTKTGNTLNVGTASSSRIVVNTDDIDLAASGITPGTYTSLTIDAYGRATAGTVPTTLAGYSISDAYTKTYIDTLFGTTVSAATSAAAAAVSETNASTSATNASTYAGNALTSANNAAASYDAFDDRYLGSKTSNPTVDNDGNALLTGALYWNSVANEMRVYSGSVWVSAYLPAAGYLALTGGTMTGDIVFAATQTGTFTQVDVTAQGDVRFQDTTGGQYVALQAPSTVGTSYTLTLPAADGTDGQVVTTDGSGNLTFTTPSGGISTGKSIAMAMIFGF